MGGSTAQASVVPSHGPDRTSPVGSFLADAGLGIGHRCPLRGRRARFRPSASVSEESDRQLRTGSDGCARLECKGTVKFAGPRRLMKLAPLFVCLTLATPLGAQNPRPTILIGPTSPDPADDPVVASSGDLTIAAYRNTSSGQVFVTSSDDRGLEFSPPVRIDDDFTGAAKRLEEWSVQISGDLVLVAWEDERSAGADGADRWKSRLGEDFGDFVD